MHLRMTRLTLAGLTLCWSLIGYGVHQVRAEEVLWPHLWGPLFLAAALTTGWLAVTLRRLPLFISMVLIVFGLVGRIGATWMRANAPDSTVTFDRVYALAGGYLAILILAAGTWVVVLGPIVSWHGQQKGRS